LELIEAGASSFKIEGRLKDISYVKNVTSAYSQRLNEIIRRHPDQYCRSSRGECHYSFTPDLRRTFNRGYTTYFLKGRQPDIASFDTPKAIGEYVGVVKELRHDSFNVAGVASFSNGDGLCFMREDRQLEGFRANRVVGNRIYPYKMPHGLQPGTRLYRNNDQEFERLLSRPSAERRITIRMALRAVSDGFELSADNQVVHVPFEHQQAQKPPHENIIRQLTKLGDTIFHCDEVDIPADFNYFIPNSILSDMRRQLVEKVSFYPPKSENNTGRRAQLGNETRGGLNKCMSGGEWSYLYNISNGLSQQFYGASEKTAYELKGGDGPIMQCRHCIRYALGYCVKYGGKRPLWREPLSLVLGDGRRFRLEFDCKNCQMNVYSMHNS
jgi:putative protease